MGHIGVLGCNPGGLGRIHVCMYVSMHITAPAVATIIMEVDQFNSREALPACYVLYFPLLVILAGNDQQHNHAVKYETAAGDFKDGRPAKAKGRKKQKYDNLGPDRWSMSCQAMTPKHDDTAAESDTSLLAQVLTSHLTLCNDHQSPSRLELSSATARDLTGLTRALKVLRCIAVSNATTTA